MFHKLLVHFPLPLCPHILNATHFQSPFLNVLIFNWMIKWLSWGHLRAIRKGFFHLKKLPWSIIVVQYHPSSVFALQHWNSWVQMLLWGPLSRQSSLRFLNSNEFPDPEHSLRGMDTGWKCVIGGEGSSVTARRRAILQTAFLSRKSDH